MIQSWASRQGWLRYVVAIVAVAAAVAVRAGLLGALGTRAAYVTFFPAVMIASLYGGLPAGLLATFLSGVAATYWIPPVGRFLVIEDAADALGMLVFLASCTMIAYICETMHRSGARAREARAEAARAEERARAAEVIRENEAQLRAVFESAPLPMLLLDRERMVRQANPAAVKLAGASLQATLGRRSGEALGCLGAMNDAGGCGFGPLCENCTLRETIADTFDAGRPHEQVASTSKLIRDGQVREAHLLVSTTPVKLGGEPLVLLCIENVTERKEAAEALQQQAEQLAQQNEELNQQAEELAQQNEELTQQAEHMAESEQRYRNLFESMDEGFALCEMIHDEAGKGCDFRYLEVNPAFEKLTGLSPKAVVGRRVSEAIPGIERYWIESYDRVVRTGQAERFANHVMVLGREFEVYAYRPAPGRFAAIFSDITERKRAEEALRHSEEQLRIAAMAAEIGMWSWKPGTSHVVVSANWRKLFGIRDDAPVTFETWRDALHVDDREHAVAELNAASEQRREFNVEYRVVHADGTTRWIIDRGRAWYDEQGRPVGMAGVNVDITERKRAEEALFAAKAAADKAKEAAEYASKAKDHFLAVLSHELRTPLAPVLVTVGMLQKDPHFDADTRESLEMIRRNVELEARLIDDLLDVTRIVRGKVELDKRPVELRTVIHRAVEVCRPDIEARKLHFGVDIEDGQHVVEADIARLQQVFWNLLKNAIKFTPVGGCVGVRVRREKGQADKETRGQGEDAGAPVSFSACPLVPLSFVCIEVSDSGVGIDAETMPRLFNAFEQGERSMTRQFGGLGLGLAISKAMVEMHGGSIEAFSEGRNKGARFRVRLPLAQVGSRQLAVGSGDRRQLPTANRQLPTPLRILLVEDHGDTSRIMARLLEASGHTIETAADVATALKLAGERPFDLLLSDLGLPDGSGLDLMRALRDQGMRLPGIALSGFGQEQDIAQSRCAGFAAHLTKPVSLPQLEEAIASVLTRPSSHRTR